MSWIGSILIGLAAGALAGLVLGQKKRGCLWTTILGLLGSVVGGWVYSLLGLESSGSLWAQLVCSFVGACVILFVVGLFRRR